MPDLGRLREFLAGAQIDPTVFALRPDYRAELLAVGGLVPGASDSVSDALLREAETAACEAMAHRPVEQLPHVTRYTGAPRLVRATGGEPFDTVADGSTMIEHPDPGEVVWCDDAGVTCRRWNWRQAVRTQLRENTTTALFILDALDPMTDQALHAAAEDLLARLRRLGPDVRAVHRQIKDDMLTHPWDAAIGDGQSDRRSEREPERQSERDRT